MIVVADAGPIHYLVLVGAVDVLQPRYTRVLVPQTVAEELRDARAPDAVRNWIALPPTWCEIRPDPPSDPALQFLDPGERAAIALALSLHAGRLLMDEWEGRAEAERRHLRVIGTLGIWRRPINSICSISKRRLHGSARPASIFQRNSSIACAVGCPPECGHRERGARVAADLNQCVRPVE